jgi:predicted ATP-grasp superfamily ATP-dependent carboligase
VARGLADAGFTVSAVASARARIAPAHWSRSVNERLVMPDPLTARTAFLTALEQRLSRGDLNALIPGSDASLLAISAGRAGLEPHVRIGLASHARVERALDKADLAATAARHGLETPQTVVCSDPARALAAGRELGYPVVIKPLSSISEHLTPRRRVSSVLAADAGDVQRAVTDFGGSALVQRHADGSIVSFAGVFAAGRLLAEAFSRYRRTWHPDAGNACYSETEPAPDELRSRAVSLLEDLGWEGLFELELIDPGQGRWHAIDMNPRPYG